VRLHLYEKILGGTKTNLVAKCLGQHTQVRVRLNEPTDFGRRLQVFIVKLVGDYPDDEALGVGIDMDFVLWSIFMKERKKVRKTAIRVIPGFVANNAAIKSLPQNCKIFYMWSDHGW
jgi:hypothetical protein